jgi:hypothetical protein
MVFCGVSLRVIAPFVALMAVLSAPVDAAATMLADSTTACAALVPAPPTAAKDADLPSQAPISRRLELNDLAENVSSHCQTSDESVVQRDTVTEVPENPTWGALLAGMAGMAVMRYRRSQPRMPLL